MPENVEDRWAISKIDPSFPWRPVPILLSPATFDAGAGWSPHRRGDVNGKQTQTPTFPQGGRWRRRYVGCHVDDQRFRRQRRTVLLRCPAGGPHGKIPEAAIHEAVATMAGVGEPNGSAAGP